MSTYQSIIDQRPTSLCLTEAMSQARGLDCCPNGEHCSFAHSIPEARANFRKTLEEMKVLASKTGKKGVAVFYVRVHSQHKRAEEYGGRLTKNGVFYTMKIDSYIKFFSEVLLQEAIRKHISENANIEVLVVN
jgi:hypothetical protein